MFDIYIAEWYTVHSEFDTKKLARFLFAHVKTEFNMYLKALICDITTSVDPMVWKRVVVQ